MEDFGEIGPGPITNVTRSDDLISAPLIGAKRRASYLNGKGTRGGSGGSSVERAAACVYVKRARTICTAKRLPGKIRPQPVTPQSKVRAAKSSHAVVVNDTNPAPDERS